MRRPLSRARTSTPDGSLAARRKAAVSPSAASTRLALGEIWIPAPTSLKPVRRSITVTSWPASDSARAAVRPPIPAPTIPIRRVRLSEGTVWGAYSAASLASSCQTQACGSASSAFRPAR
jgi:hypothetical protein